MNTKPRVPSKGTWFYVECQPFTTDEEIQEALYKRCGMDVSLDRINIRQDESGKAKYWRGVVSLLPCHIDQAINFSLDAENLKCPIYFLPFPKNPSRSWREHEMETERERIEETK